MDLLPNIGNLPNISENLVIFRVISWSSSDSTSFHADRSCISVDFVVRIGPWSMLWLDLSWPTTRCLRGVGCSWPDLSFCSNGLTVCCYYSRHAHMRSWDTSAAPQPHTNIHYEAGALTLLTPHHLLFCATDREYDCYVCYVFASAHCTQNADLNKNVRDARERGSVDGGGYYYRWGSRLPDEAGLPAIFAHNGVQRRVSAGLLIERISVAFFFLILVGKYPRSEHGRSERGAIACDLRLSGNGNCCCRVVSSNWFNWTYSSIIPRSRKREAMVPYCCIVHCCSATVAK